MGLPPKAGKPRATGQLGRRRWTAVKPQSGAGYAQVDPRFSRVRFVRDVFVIACNYQFTPFREHA